MSRYLYDECEYAIRDNKCSECNDFYQCSLTDYLEEHDAKVRADAIDEFVKAIEKHQTRQDSYLEPPYVEMGLDMTDILYVAEQLKENKNGE